MTTFYESLSAFISYVLSDASTGTEWTSCNVDVSPLGDGALFPTKTTNLIVDPTVTINGDSLSNGGLPLATNPANLIDPTVNGGVPKMETPKASSGDDKGFSALVPVMADDDIGELILKAIAEVQLGEGNSATFTLGFATEDGAATAISSIKIWPSPKGEFMPPIPDAKGMFGYEAQQINHGIREHGIKVCDSFDKVAHGLGFVGVALFFSAFCYVFFTSLALLFDAGVIGKTSLKYSIVLLFVFTTTTVVLAIRNPSWIGAYVDDMLNPPKNDKKVLVLS